MLHSNFHSCCSVVLESDRSRLSEFNSVTAPQTVDNYCLIPRTWQVPSICRRVVHQANQLTGYPQEGSSCKILHSHCTILNCALCAYDCAFTCELQAVLITERRDNGLPTWEHHHTSAQWPGGTINKLYTRTYVRTNALSGRSNGISTVILTLQRTTVLTYVRRVTPITAKHQVNCPQVLNSTCIRTSACLSEVVRRTKKIKQEH